MENFLKAERENQYQISNAFNGVQRALGLDGFHYWSTDKDGRLTFLSNSPQFGDEYFGSGDFLSNTLWADPRLILPGPILAGLLEDSELKQLLTKFQDLSFRPAPFILIRSSGEKCQGFGFNRTGGSTSELYHTCLAKLALLESFADYFLESQEGVILEAEENSINLRRLKGTSRFCRFPVPGKFGVKDDEAVIEALNRFENLDLRAHWIRRLSRQQKKCLRLGVMGMTNKQIAQKLDLSPRTVESYFDEVKTKLHCSYKSDVLFIAYHLERLGCLM